MTKVTFLTSPLPNDGNEVFAYFPEDIPLFESTTSCRESYCHFGQHSPCHKEFAKDCSYAKPHEYKELYKELVARGYNDLSLTFKI